MSIAQSFIPEFDKEMATTRRVLERVPEARGEWKPHQKSHSLGDLATHVANLPTWIPLIAAADFYDVVSTPRRPPKFTTTAALLEFFDGNVAKSREALLAMDDEHMMKPWSLKRGDQTVFTTPRAAVLRSFVMNHHIHHRGQLSVYLRLNDVPLPNMYGPTADEK
jgi:uncharacterized damage-inducible protein DinB